MSGPTDFYDDKNQQQLYALDHLCPLPGFVKQAETDYDVVEKLASDSFGDLRRRKFPCHTKEATWLANAYFQQARSHYSKIDQDLVQGRINKFASHWAISGLVNQFNHNWAKIAAFEQTELPDDQYGLVATTDEGIKLKRFPMPNMISVKFAAERLFADRYKYPYPMRKVAARNILRRAIGFDDMAKAGELVATTPMPIEPMAQEYLERAAGFGATHPLRAAEKIAQRVVMLKRTHLDHAEKLAELAVMVREMPSVSSEQLDKIASLVDLVDRETGLDAQYHLGVDLPEEMFFQVLEKEAEAVLDEHVMLTTGKSYPIGLLMSIPLEKISSVLGNDFMEAVTDTTTEVDPVKFAEILPTLPRSDALLLERAIEESLKEPMAKTARAGNMSKAEFSKDEFVGAFTKAGKKVKSEDFNLTIKG